MAVDVRQVWTGCPFCLNGPHTGPCVLVAHMPGKHNQKDHAGGKRKPGPTGDRQVKSLTGDAALAAPPEDLTKLTSAGDPRAAALWHRNGANGDQMPDGRPGFETMNKEMRTGTISPETSARVADIDSVMAESKLSAPIEVYRGISNVPAVLGEPGTLKGLEFTDSAFASTTTDISHAKRLQGFDGAVLKIRAPAGASAIRMADTGGLKESEILLDRNLKFRVIDERFTTFTFQGETKIKDHEIDIEVVP